MFLLRRVSFLSFCCLIDVTLTNNVFRVDGRHLWLLSAFLLPALRAAGGYQRRTIISRVAGLPPVTELVTTTQHPAILWSVLYLLCLLWL